MPIIFAPEWQLLFFAATASFVAATTPGPNNFVCMSIGANFGFRRALPFAFGVVVGFPLLLLASAAGLGSVLFQFPQLHWIFKIGGVILLLHMSWKIAMSRQFDKGGNKKAPGFFRAILFQWINPKAITYALSMIATFTRPGETLVSDVFYLVLISAAVAMFSTVVWAAFGTMISRLLKSQKALAIFNGIMGGLLALASLSILLI
ncbi:MAG: LysE family translocator [Gammaproteobacteria bacterium WSBS_2016_MAG_OTU1]